MPAQAMRDACDADTSKSCQGIDLCGKYYAECRSAIRIFHNTDPSTGLLTVSSLVPYVTWPSKAQTWNAVHVT